MLVESDKIYVVPERRKIVNTHPSFVDGLMALRGKMIDRCQSRWGIKTDAEDIVQDAMIAALTGSYDDKNSIAAWFRTIVDSKTIDYFRSQSRRSIPQSVSLDALQVSQNGFVPKQFIDQREAVEDHVLQRVTIQESLQSLTPNQQQEIILYSSGYSMSEIARKEGVGHSVVIHRINAVRKKMNKKYNNFQKILDKKSFSI